MVELMLEVERTKIADTLLLSPRCFSDERGFFSETWNKKRFEKAGVTVAFVQDNHSLSKPAGTVRGLHFQTPPHAQDKLVRVVRGRIYDVAVDIRIGSPTYGKWIGYELSAENAKQLFIPKGFLHGFVTLEPNTEVIYKCSDYYAPECDGSVRFDDPDLAIDWGIDESEATLSEKDSKAQSFSEFVSPFTYQD